jgi:hypothetical protein
MVIPFELAAFPRRATHLRLSFPSSTTRRFSIPRSITWCRTLGASSPACLRILPLAPSCPLQNHYTILQEVHFVKNLPPPRGIRQAVSAYDRNGRRIQVVIHHGNTQESLLLFGESRSPLIPSRPKLLRLPASPKRPADSDKLPQVSNSMISTVYYGLIKGLAKVAIKSSCLELSTAAGKTYGSRFLQNRPKDLTGWSVRIRPE